MRQPETGLVMAIVAIVAISPALAGASVVGATPQSQTQSTPVDLTVSAPGEVSPGETFTVTYTITNTGSETSAGGSIQLEDPALPLSISGDDAKFIVSTLSPGSSTTKSFTISVASNATSGSVSLTGQGNLSYLSGASGTDTASISVDVNASSSTNSTGGNSTSGNNTANSLNLSVDAPNEVAPGGDFTAEVTFSNPRSESAAGGNVNLTGLPSEFSVQGSQNKFLGFGTSPPAPGATKTYTFQVDVNNSATVGDNKILVSGASLSYGSSDTISALSTTQISIVGSTGPPALPNQANPPTNLDNDDQYEDVNGDGQLDEDDVRALANNINSNAVQNNAAAYDFSGNGQVGFGDARQLYKDYLLEDGAQQGDVVDAIVAFNNNGLTGQGEVPNQGTIIDLIVAFNNR